MAAAIGRALLEHRQLVDASTVEELLASYGDLLARDEQRDALAEPAATMAALRRVRTAGGATPSGGGTAGIARRVVREVRHVALVHLRIGGVEGLGLLAGRGAVTRELASLRATLDGIAYKHGAIWSWLDDRTALAVVGLLANPSRAAEDAAKLAVDVHEFLAGRSDDLGVSVTAAIGLVRGIASGERDEQGHLVEHALEPPASEIAAELGAHTPLGSTWVAGGVQRLVRHAYQWDDVPALPLDGFGRDNLPNHLRIHALVRPLTSDERHAELALAPSDLVGREAERAELLAAYQRAVQDLAHVGEGTTAAPRVARARDGVRGELVAHVVVGEMGIGKTALVRAFVHDLGDEVGSFTVECSPVSIDLPYAVVADLVRVVTELHPEATLDEAHEAVRRTLRVRPGRADRIVERLSRLVTHADDDLQDEDAAAQHHELTVRSVKLLIGALAERGPLVVIVDGLQWADRASLELLERVLSRPERSPVLMLLVTRPDERVEPYLERMMRSELRGLSADEQVRLVKARLGVRRGVADVCRELVPRVGGNPYFLLEMVDALLERGALELVESDDDGGLVRNDARFDEQAELLPSTVEQLVSDRLNELPKEERDVVDWLAVAGGPLTSAELVNLARLVDDEPLARLCARGLCDRRGASLDFRHPLARDVAYQDLDVVHRARMHRALGEHLLGTPLAHGLSAAIVAHHLEAGDLPERAAERYFEAALAARNASQTQLALRYFKRTAELLRPDDPKQLPTEDGLVRIHRQLGELPERRRHFAALRRLAFKSRSARWIATTLMRAAQLDHDEGAMARGLPLARRAVEVAELSGDADLQVEALIVVCEHLRDLGDVTGALEACDRALRVANTKRVSRRARGEVLRAKGVLLRRAGRIHAAVEAHAEATAIFELEGARRSEARARNALGFALFVLGRFEDSIAMCLQSLAIDLMVGGRFQVAKTLANVGLGYARLGDTTQALAYIARAREAHERYDDLDGWVDTLLVLASLLVEEGRVVEAEPLVLDAAAILAASDNAYDRTHCLVVQALVARAKADHVACAKHAAEARRRAEEQALVSYHVYATALEAVARVELGSGQAGVLLATTALGAVEAMEGSEYGIEVRSLCCEAVIRALGADGSGAGATVMTDVCRRALSHVDALSGFIRDPAQRERFMMRPPVRSILDLAMRFVPSSEGGDADSLF
ncbi:MAG: AAA family ATPase [Deltaproteobacteria bacterium]|nr:AAA family ATPase [Deltaproteobacteria bacterium]